MTLAGATARRDGNDPFGEGFVFASVAEYAAFRAAHPELFDRELSAEERRRHWQAFAQTSEGRALRWR